MPSVPIVPLYANLQVIEVTNCNLCHVHYITLMIFTENRMLTVLIIVTKRRYGRVLAEHCSSPEVLASEVLYQCAYNKERKRFYFFCSGSIFIRLYL